MALGQLCRTENCTDPAMRDSAYCEECWYIRFLDDINSEPRVIPKLKAAAEASKGIISDGGQGDVKPRGLTLSEETLDALTIDVLRLLRKQIQETTGLHPISIAAGDDLIASIDVILHYLGAVE